MIIQHLLVWKNWNSDQHKTQFPGKVSKGRRGRQGEREKSKRLNGSSEKWAGKTIKPLLY
jgi:hypothetical protein